MARLARALEADYDVVMPDARGLDERFGLEYLPEAVLVESLDGVLRPALCYLAAHMPETPPEPRFVKQLAECARTMHLPEWYALHIELLG